MNRQGAVQEVVDDFDREVGNVGISDSGDTLDGIALSGTSCGGAEVQF